MRRLILTCLIPVMLASCGSDDTTGPRQPAEPEIINSEGHFSFNAAGFSGVTETLSYEWLNTAAIAQVDMNGRIDWGRGALTISDGVGSPVFSFDLTTDGGTYLTDIGAPGSWTIRIDLANAAGDIDLVVTAVE